MTIVYNLLMAAADAVALGFLAGGNRPARWFLSLPAAGVVAAILAAVLREDGFGAMRLGAYGLFLHGGLLLLGSALLLWRSSRMLSAGCLLGVMALAAVAIDAFLIEPHWLEVSRVEIASPKIERPCRIVLITDLQTDGLGEYERGVLQVALEQRPDVLLLGGDYLQAPWDEQQRLAGELNELLGETDFRAPQGVFAIRGNVDGDDWKTPFAGLPVACVDRTTAFELPSFDLTCLGLRQSYDAALRVQRPRQERFHVVLGHSPNYAAGRIEADLLLAGHTHGGQVRLPWFGPPVKNTVLPRAWAAGATDLPSGAKLVVARGIGMERGYAPRLRFLCRPELVVIDLLPAEER